MRHVIPGVIWDYCCKAVLQLVQWSPRWSSRGVAVNKERGDLPGTCLNLLVCYPPRLSGVTDDLFSILFALCRCQSLLLDSICSPFVLCQYMGGMRILFSVGGPYIRQRISIGQFIVGGRRFPPTLNVDWFTPRKRSPALKPRCCHYLTGCFILRMNVCVRFR